MWPVMVTRLNACDIRPVFRKRSVAACRKASGSSFKRDEVRFLRLNESLPLVLLALAGLLGGGILYCWNPTEVAFIPRCPFRMWTGWQCPGCGTLRGLHALLHLRLAEAWQLNPFMVVSLPLLAVLSVSRRVRRSQPVLLGALLLVCLWWGGRNLFV